MRVVKKQINNYGTIEFIASKLQFQDAILFLQRRCDGILSRNEAINWCHQISRIFPESTLAKTFNQPITALSKKETRRLAKKEAMKLANQQLEMLFLFTFKK